MIMVNSSVKSWLTMVPLSRSWQIMIYGTHVKIMANHDIWERMSRSWQDLEKITMLCHGSYQGYYVKNSKKKHFELLTVFQDS